MKKIHDDTAVDLPPECSQKRLLMDESTYPTHIRCIDGAERDAIRVNQRSQFQSLFSTSKKSTPVACKEQFGPLSQPCLQKKDDRQKDRRAAVLVVSSEHVQGKDDLINRKNLERSSGNPVPDGLKRFNRAMQEATSREKGEREAPHKQGTGTKTKIDTFPFPGNNCRSSLYRETATIRAAADVGVPNRDNTTRNDDVAQSLKDLILRSQPRFREEERWPRQNKSGISQLANARVQSRNGIKAEKGYGPNSENTILSASPHIYEILGCDHTNKDNQEEEKLGSKNAEKARDLENR